MENSPHDATWRRVLRRRLLSWFRQSARDLPWRHTRDPYAIWVSEIMLQQTQVATVIPYFERFLADFPNVAALARAPQDEVLKRWEGLGYYRRARQLHAAARVVMDEHGGKIPSDFAALHKLPGIGRYTAGAILSIAQDQRLPILEANTIRLLSRLLALREDPRATTGQALLWQTAEQLLPRRDVGAFNQALMELGSEICTPRQPACERCPVWRQCPTHAAGLQAEIPLAPRKTQYEQLKQACVIVRRRQVVLLRQCQPDERWAGLWDYPRFDVQATRGQRLREELAEAVHRLTGVTVEPGERLMTIKHGVTRYRITLSCFNATFRGGRPIAASVRWVPLEKLTDYPLNVTGRKISQRLAAL